jgi:SNF2 family DNA or RNA helicase
VTIVDRVELDNGQRALYDRIRSNTEHQIRNVMAERGFARSRMDVLEALLRLRQVCCDPRLLKTSDDFSDVSSAKLTRLIEMLEELFAEGRHALVFSQFTTMLDLIEPRLRDAGIGFVRLSGDTQDRGKPVRQIQNGEAPVFLISLRAGGTGLNLTAADTVIHFDPWWNPAVENQATDRAHRIGQNKTVFVYKLVASNTVEEKILELQQRKADLAGRLLGEGSDLVGKLTEDDIRWVLS